MSIIHGYYLPHQGILGGELELAAEAQTFYCDKLGLDARFAKSYDGCSIFSRADGSLTVRVVLQNFFSEELDVKTHDYPYAIKEIAKPCYCGGGIRLLPATDKDFHSIVKGGNFYYVPIPSHILLPKCDLCSEVYLGQTNSDQLDQKLREYYESQNN